MVAKSFQKMEKVRTIDRLERVMGGDPPDSADLSVSDSRDPVSLNCELKKILNSLVDRMRTLRTRRNYMDRHAAKLARVASE